MEEEKVADNFQITPFHTLSLVPPVVSWATGMSVFISGALSGQYYKGGVSSDCPSMPPRLEWSAILSFSFVFTYITYILYAERQKLLLCSCQLGEPPRRCGMASCAGRDKRWRRRLVVSFGHGCHWWPDTRYTKVEHKGALGKGNDRIQSSPLQQREYREERKFVSLTAFFVVFFSTGIDWQNHVSFPSEEKKISWKCSANS